MAGSQGMIRRFIAESETRVHGSPPSVAVIQAALHALSVNQERGDSLRERLAQRVGQFRKGLAQIGLSSIGGWFPVQTLQGLIGYSAVRLHQHLLRRGIHTVLTHNRNEEASLTFVITVLHSTLEIDRCIDIVGKLTNDYHASFYLNRAHTVTGL
jgi:8-amino-7-oxononanoate synthase